MVDCSESSGEVLTKEDVMREEKILIDKPCDLPGVLDCFVKYIKVNNQRAVDVHLVPLSGHLCAVRWTENVGDEIFQNGSEYCNLFRIERSIEVESYDIGIIIRAHSLIPERPDVIMDQYDVKRLTMSPDRKSNEEVLNVLKKTYGMVIKQKKFVSKYNI